MIKNLTFAILLGVSSIGAKQAGFTESDEVIAMQVELETVQEIEAKYGLQFCGNGGGMMGGIQSMALSFNCYSPMTKENAAMIISKCIYTFLDNVNNNADIKPRLCKYPFGMENIKVSIFFSQTDGSSFEEMDYDILTAKDDNIRFLNSDTLFSETIPMIPLSELNYDDDVQNAQQ